MPDIIQFLADNRFFFRAAHLLVFALGMGSALLADLFLFRFVRDSKITEREVGVLKNFSQIIWFSLIIFTISGIALTVPRAEIFLESAKFQVKILAIVVIVINGILLNVLVSPKLLRIFGEKYSAKDRYLRKIAFGLGAVSITSWFTAFLLSVFRNLKIEFLPLLGIYLGALLFNILISQIIELRLSKRAWPFSS